MERKIIGEQKAGLTLQIRQTPTVMSLTGRPDPLLLFVVVAAALALGLIGSVAATPREGLITFLAFSFLFSPIIGFLIFNALRVKGVCVLDREEGLLRISEQSYTRRIQEVYPLSDVVAVRVRALPGAPLLGGARVYGVLLDLGTVDYLVACSNDEGTVSQDAWRISRFLGIPLEAPPEEPAPTPVGPRVVLTTGLIYLLPIVLAILVLLFFLDQLPRTEIPLVGLLGAVVIPQLAAMAAFAYYRARRASQ